MLRCHAKTITFEALKNRKAYPSVILTTYDGGQHKSGSKDVDGLRELLDDVPPDETHDPEENDDDPGQVLGSGLAVEVLENVLD